MELQRTPKASVVYFVDAFPVLSETFVSAEAAALRRHGYAVRVEATTPPAAEQRGSDRGVQVTYLAADPLPQKLRDVIRLAARHPLRCAADLARRRRWSRDEEVLPLRSLAPAARRIGQGEPVHLHAHFATGAALNAMRLSLLLGVPWSLTAHAYEIYSGAHNLPEKIERSAFTTSGCDYTVRDLRGLVSEKHRSRVHKIVMGIDPEEFRRKLPYPGGRTVVAVGRLVEKKGLSYLLEAVARLERSHAIDELIVAGDGPLAGELRALSRRLGIDGKVTFLGATAHHEVKQVLERADLLAAPCVIAADGDRDSMPVVVKEALAMEVPVVASDEVGLPEVVRPEWGRLVPPRDSAALAVAIGDLLALPREKRVAAGRAGRAWVEQNSDVATEAGKLQGLIRSPCDPTRPPATA